MNKENTIYRYLLLVIATELIAISVNFFYAPINIAVGGGTGIAILLEAVLKIPTAISVFVFNVIMVILAWIFLGKVQVKRIIIGSFLLPVLMAITPSFKLTDNPLLAVIIAGCLFGVGVSLLYRINYSAGGTTVPPMILKKYFFINPTISLLVIDMSIIVMNVFVSGMEAFLMAAFSQVITTLVMQATEAGLDLKYQVEILSNEHQGEIKEFLLANYQGLTIYNFIGGYTQEKKEELLLVVDRQEYAQLIAQLHKIDPDAFIISSKVMKVHGGRWGI